MNAARQPLTPAATSELGQILALLNDSRDKHEGGDYEAHAVAKEARERLERLIATAAVPRIGQPWPGVDGVYAGIARGENGGPDHHLVLLNALPDKRLNWNDAVAWALSVEGDLPTRNERALLFAHLQYFGDGGQHYRDKSYEGRARAVRRFVIE